MREFLTRQPFPFSPLKTDQAPTDLLVSVSATLHNWLEACSVMSRSKMPFVRDYQLMSIRKLVPPDMFCSFCCCHHKSVLFLTMDHVLLTAVDKYITSFDYRWHSEVTVGSARELIFLKKTKHNWLINLRITWLKFCLICSQCSAVLRGPWTIQWSLIMCFERRDSCCFASKETERMYLINCRELLHNVHFITR